MSDFATEYQRVKTNISNAYDKIEEKGGTIPITKNSANLTDAIDSIETEEINNSNVLEMIDGKSKRLGSNSGNPPSLLFQNNILKIFFYQDDGHSQLWIYKKSQEECIWNVINQTTILSGGTSAPTAYDCIVLQNKYIIFSYHRYNSYSAMQGYILEDDNTLTTSSTIHFYDNYAQATYNLTNPLTYIDDNNFLYTRPTSSSTSATRISYSYNINTGVYTEITDNTGFRIGPGKSEILYKNGILHRKLFLYFFN